MTLNDSDQNNIRRLQELGSPVVSDALLKLGHLDHMATPGMRPVNRGHACAGPIRIARFEPALDGARDFGPLARFIDGVTPGEVLVLTSSPNIAPGALWGDICSSVAETNRAGGVVIDGFMRDELTLEQSALPVFSRGTFSRDGLAVSNIGAVDEPTTVGGLLVRPGEMVLADIDGVVFFKADLIEELITVCEQMLVAEASLRDVLRSSAASGGTLADAVARIGAM